MFFPHPLCVKSWSALYIWGRSSHFRLTSVKVPCAFQSMTRFETFVNMVLKTHENFWHYTTSFSNLSNKYVLFCPSSLRISPFRVLFFQQPCWSDSFPCKDVSVSIMSFHSVFVSLFYFPFPQMKNGFCAPCVLFGFLSECFWYKLEIFIAYYPTTLYLKKVFFCILGDLYRISRERPSFLWHRCLFGCICWFPPCEG